LLVRNRLAVNGEGVRGVIAEPMEKTVGVGGNPGVASVTRELSSEELLSSGSLSKSSRSTFVWVLASVSTRSPASVTVTLSLAAPTTMANFTSTGN
jgi:hypothetical protein